MLKRSNVKMKESGFTLVEVMVTIAVFSIIIGAITGVFISGTRQQIFALNLQSLWNQTSFALEYMNRALRLAAKESGQGCLSQGPGFNYEITKGGAGLKFINTLEQEDCQEFFLEEGQLKHFRQSTGLTLPLTSDKLSIGALRFNLVGESQSDEIQPKVTLFLEVNGVKIQTSISQRELDVVF